MRATFALAALLGTTVATLAATMSGQEFARWQVWMQAEQIGPDWAAMHRAETLAALHNGGQYRKQGGGHFAAADFARPDPWATAPQLSPQQELARQQAEYEALMRAQEA